MCSRSGADADSAPTVAGLSGPCRAATNATAASPLVISKRRLAISSCGTRSSARCNIGPIRSARARERASSPAAAPLATWSVTIIASPDEALVIDDADSWPMDDFAVEGWTRVEDTSKVSAELLLVSCDNPAACILDDTVVRMAGDEPVEVAGVVRLDVSVDGIVESRSVHGRGPRCPANLPTRRANSPSRHSQRS
jgi:hypothetical protein